MKEPMPTTITLDSLAGLFLTLRAEDGSLYAVPVEVIARNRAAHYAPLEYGGDVDQSMLDDTIPLFLSDTYEVQDWAANNMDWDDVKDHAVKVRDAAPPDMADVWRRGERAVARLDLPAAGA